MNLTREYDKARMSLANPNGVQYFEGYEEINGYVRPSSVAPLPRGQIFINEKVQEYFELFKSASPQKEIPFFLIARDDSKHGEPNHIVITGIVFDSSYNPRQKETHYSSFEKMINNVYYQIKDIPDVILIQGHSHPLSAGGYEDYFSLGDVYSLVNMSENYPDVQVGSIVFAPQRSNDPNSYEAKTLFYDRHTRKCYSADAPFQLLNNYQLIEIDCASENQMC